MKRILKKLFGFSEDNKARNISSSIKPVKKSDSKKISNYKLSIKRSGSRSIKLSKLLQDFGYKKIGSKNLIQIEENLKAHNLYCFPSITSNIKRESRVKIYNYPVRSLGDLFEREKDLEDYIDKNKAYKKLNIQSVKRQASPEGTKDKIDFLGFEKNGKEVVVELKHYGGDKRAIEQVLRYAGILKKNRKTEIRKILITGVVELSISEAIYGMEEKDKKYFEWYVYNWDKCKDNIKFERITNEYIKKEITKMYDFSN